MIGLVKGFDGDTFSADTVVVIEIDVDGDIVGELIGDEIDIKSLEFILRISSSSTFLADNMASEDRCGIIKSLFNDLCMAFDAKVKELKSAEFGINSVF